MPRTLARDMKASLSFNGSTSKVSIPSVSGFPLMNNSALSVSGWVRSTSTAKQTIFSDGNSGTNAPSYQLGTISGNAFCFFVRNDANTTLVPTALTAARYRTSEWNYITLTDNNGVVRLYVNGVSDSTVAGGAWNYSRAGSVFTFNNSNFGGWQRLTYVDPFFGNLADMVTHTRDLSAAEAASLYSTATVPTGSNLRYKLNEGAGTVANDSSGNVNHGTIAAGVFASETPTKARLPVNPNLVYNGDFEYAPPFTAANTTLLRWIDGTAGGSATNKLFGWFSFDQNAAGTAIRFDPTVSHSGTGSLKLSLADSSARSIQVFSESTPFKSIAVIPNTSYTFTYWMKTNTTSGDSAEGANAVASERDSTGTFVIERAGTLVKTTTGWTQYTVTFTTSSNARYILIKLKNIGASGAGTLLQDAWFDDLDLRPTAPVTRSLTTRTRRLVGEMIENGDFEFWPGSTTSTINAARWVDGAGGLPVPGNSIYRWGLTNTSSGSVTSRFDTVNPFSGGQSMRLAVTATNSRVDVTPCLDVNVANNIKQFGIPVQPSTSYTGSYWMRTNYTSGSGSFGADVSFREATAAGALSTTNDGTFVQTTTGWTKYTVTFTTASTTRFILPRLQILGTGGAANLIMDANFDNISLMPTITPTRAVVN